MDRLSKDRVETIKARYKYYLDKPESTFDGLPMVAMILDLEEAREHRRILREALQRLEWSGIGFDSRYGWEVPICRECHHVKGTAHSDDCRIGKAIVATEEKASG